MNKKKNEKNAPHRIKKLVMRGNEKTTQSSIVTENAWSACHALEAKRFHFSVFLESVL